MTKLREKFPDVTFQCFYDEPDARVRGTIKWHVVTSAETLTTHTRETKVPQISNPTYIITGNIP